MVLQTNKITVYPTVWSDFSFVQYKSKSINIAKTFGVSGDDPNSGNDDDNSDVNVAPNEHQKSRSILHRKSKNLGEIR